AMLVDCSTGISNLAPARSCKVAACTGLVTITGSRPAPAATRAAIRFLMSPTSALAPPPVVGVKPVTPFKSPPGVTPLSAWGAEHGGGEKQRRRLADQGPAHRLDVRGPRHLVGEGRDDHGLARRERRPGGDALSSHLDRLAFAHPAARVGAIDEVAGDFDAGGS